jgi:hypothetical protein|nr:iron-containing redox enzyme family protein [Kofleriaceae bacterium]
MTTNRFWAMADAAQAVTTQRADACFRGTEDCDLAQLRALLLPYRWFTVYYIGDLAHLIAKLAPSGLRSFLGHVLDDELGNGDDGGAHPALYDAFLRSLGVGDDAIAREHARAIELLAGARDALIAGSAAYAVGLRGMGGECMCQVYLDRLHASFTRNPRVQAMRDAIDWRFWDIHVGPTDVHHREQTRALLERWLAASPELAPEIAAGFDASLRGWDAFWTAAVAS